MEINGKKVVDATSKAKIHITQTDAIKGANKDPGACAAARAAKRDIADCLSARVHIGRVYVEHKTKWVRYFTPDALRTEIIAFDRGGTFQLGVYELKPPSKTETEEARKEYRTDDRHKNKKAAAKAKSPRNTLKIARIKRHNVSGIRPSGANR